MGQVASELSDINILTTDNPRHEDPSMIVEQIADGFKSKDNYKIILDRREAIETALLMAQKGDVVLLAGKGHETYQEVRGIRLPFDDREVAVEILRSLLSEPVNGGKIWKN